MPQHFGDRGGTSRAGRTCGEGRLNATFLWMKWEELMAKPQCWPQCDVKLKEEGLKNISWKMFHFISTYCCCEASSVHTSTWSFYQWCCCSCLCLCSCLPFSAHLALPLNPVERGVQKHCILWEKMRQRFKVALTSCYEWIRVNKRENLKKSVITC